MEMRVRVVYRLLLSSFIVIVVVNIIRFYLRASEWDDGLRRRERELCGDDMRWERGGGRLRDEGVRTILYGRWGEEREEGYLYGGFFNYLNQWVTDREISYIFFIFYFIVKVVVNFFFMVINCKVVVNKLYFKFCICFWLLRWL